MTKDLLVTAKQTFERSQDAENKNRRNWIDDVRFARLGEQWPEKVKRQREIEGRPCLTINRLPAFIRQVTNDARQNKPSIKCHPVGDGADQETAEIYNGLIRNIEYTSDADVAYDTALDNAVTGGFGYFRISTDYACEDAFEQDIKIERISNPLTVFGDPYSTAADSSDWNDAFVTEMLTIPDFKKRFPKAEVSDFESDSYDKDTLWFQDSAIRVAEWWHREEIDAVVLKLSNGMTVFQEDYEKNIELWTAQGVSVIDQRPTKKKKVTQRIMTGAEILETNEWAGKYIPIVPVYGDEVMVEGERHWLSLVRFAKDPQQMFNFWRTASTELVALAPKTPYIGPKGAFVTDAQKWETANNVSYPYIEYDGQTPPQRQSFAGPPAGALQEALNSSDDMKSIMGLFDASLGNKSNETSGRAIMARQREGDVSTFNFIDNLSRAIRHAGRILVDLIPRVYDTKRIIRVIHEDGTNESIPINQPFQLSPQQQAEKQQEENQEQQGIMRLYDLTTGKYDVTCEVGPSYTTKREESANQMTEFVRAFPQSAPLIGDLIAKNLDWPGADEIAKRLKAMLPPQVQGRNPQVMQLQQQLQQQDQFAKEAVGQLRAEMQNLAEQLKAKEAQLADKAREDEVKRFDADTKRIQAVTAAAEKGIQLTREADGSINAIPLIPQIPQQLPIENGGNPIQ